MKYGSGGSTFIQLQLYDGLCYRIVAMEWSTGKGAIKVSVGDPGSRNVFGNTCQSIVLILLMTGLFSQYHASSDEPTQCVTISIDGKIVPLTMDVGRIEYVQEQAVQDIQFTKR